MSTQKEFINNLAYHAMKLGKQYGLFPSVMIAQAIHESGWGKSTLSIHPHFNLFGIKGEYNGKSVTMKTWEDDGSGNVEWINAAFRSYPSFYESMEDNAKLLRNGLSWNKEFYKGAWREVAGNYQNATQWLQGRYATDSSYAKKLNVIIHDWNLTKYDHASNTPVVKEERVIEMGGTFICDDTILVRDKPSTSGRHIATYKKGEQVKFERIHFKNKYIWLEYVRSVGGKGYIPITELKNLWGSVI